MPNVFVALGIVGLVAALIGVAAVAVMISIHGQRLGNLEKDLEHLKAHGAARRATVDVTEDMIAMILNVLEDAEALRARLTNVVDRAEFIRNGGSPNAPWAEVYRMKNKK